jgi:hypothetical protein
MSKKILKFTGKVLFYISYPLLIIGVIVLGVIYIQNRKENNDAIKEYRSTYEEYSDAEATRKTVRNAVRDLATLIESKQNEINEKEEEIGELQTKIEKGQQEGYGEITGAILPFVTSQTKLNQYQMVCAETTVNTNKVYCLSVSAVQKQYSLVVPAGEYYVFAKIQGEPSTDPLFSYRAYYTKYVECGSTGEANCADSLSQEKIVVKVEPNSKLENVDPVDWQTLSVTELEAAN